MWWRVDLGRIGRAVVMVSPQQSPSDAVLSTLFAKRLLFIVGKGGVGKTTVATALALAAARQQKKTLLVELEDNTRAARLLGLPPLTEPSDTPRQVSPLLFVSALNGQAALDEYLQRILPFQRLFRPLLSSRLYQYFIAAAPGIKELMSMGKVWYEEHQQEQTTGQLRWDLVIVDTPGTGHSLQYLRMPRAASDTFGDGLVHRKAVEIGSFFSDPERTAVNLVATPEELPVSETLDAYQQLHEQLHLPLGALFINRVHDWPLSNQQLAPLRINAEAPLRDRQLAEQVLACAQMETAIEAAQAPYLQQLHALPLPQVHLPFCFAEQFGPAQVEQLSYRLQRT